MAERRFTQSDLDRWTARGLLTPEQRAAILRDIDTQPPRLPN
jgi:hypothetical protein